MIETNIERIAQALESIAMSLSVEAINSVSDKPELKIVREEKEPEVVEEKKEAKKYTKEERQFIMEELAELGVDYGTRQATSYLAKLLERSKESIQKQEALVSDEPVKEEIVEEVVKVEVEEEVNDVEVSLEEAKETLKIFAAKNGLDAAKALLQKFNASKLSDVTGKDLNVLVEACR